MSEEIKGKIKKLLNLANDKGANEHEAERAMEMASALMMKYNITLDPEDTDSTEVTESSITQLPEPWHTVLASASAYLYGCKVIQYPKQGMTFVGRAENQDAAIQTLLFLASQVEAHYKMNLPKGLTKGDRAEYRRTFKYACANRVYHRAKEIMQQFRDNDAKAIEYTGSTALVVMQTMDQLIAECKTFMDELPGLRDTRPTIRKSGSGTFDGFKAGDKVQLNRAVS